MSKFLIGAQIKLRCGLQEIIVSCIDFRCCIIPHEIVCILNNYLCGPYKGNEQKLNHSFDVYLTCFGAFYGFRFKLILFHANLLLKLKIFTPESHNIIRIIFLFCQK